MFRYFGLSSTGVTFKSSAASFGSGSYSSGSHYGSTQGSKEADTSINNYSGKEWSNNRSKETISNFRSTRQMSRENTSSATNYKQQRVKGVTGGYSLLRILSVIISSIILFIAVCRHPKRYVVCCRNQDSPRSHVKSSWNLHSTSGGTNSQ